jgi:hypothetical protein
MLRRFQSSERSYRGNTSGLAFSCEHASNLALRLDIERAPVLGPQRNLDDVAICNILVARHAAINNEPLLHNKVDGLSGVFCEATFDQRLPHLGGRSFLRRVEMQPESAQQIRSTSNVRDKMVLASAR